MKTSPTSSRNYDEEYKKYQGKPEQIKRRSMRNKARRIMTKIHGKEMMKNMDVDHIDGNPCNNCISNLRLLPKSINRSKRRDDILQFIKL